MEYIELKTWPKYYNKILSGEKRCEVRKDDEKFKVGVLLKLNEWEPTDGTYTGRSVLCKVTHIFKPKDISPLFKFDIGNCCIMSIKIAVGFSGMT